MKNTTCLLIAGLLLGASLTIPAQNIRREYWLNVRGSDLGSLLSHPDYPDQWSGVDFPANFEGPLNWQDNYGSRLRGYIHPPQTGEYIFWISSDDNGQLYLSQDEYPVTKELIATVNSWTNSREWNKEPNQQSVPMQLEAGKKYYIEALQKEGGGGDNVAVAWQLPDGTFQGPIPGTHLSPFLINTDPPEIVEQPVSVTVSEGTPAEFRVVATGAEPLTFQWRRNGVDVAGENSHFIRIPIAQLSDDESTFQCFISNPLGDVVSQTVTLTVIPETVPPVIASSNPAAGSSVRSLTRLDILFSEPVEGVDATDLLVNGSPALSVSGLGAGPYRFDLPFAGTGTVNFLWASGHGIADLAIVPNDFAGGTFQVEVDPSIVLPNVVINEFLASNSSGLTDEDGQENDWIEIINRSAASVDLNGWSLTDDEEWNSRWMLPNITLPPGGFLVVFASGKDRRDPAGNLHTSFRLSQSGEYLGLLNNENPPVAADQFIPGYPEQRSDFSYGRNASDTWAYMPVPTPGAPNNNSTLSEITAPPRVSAGRGFYNQPFQLYLSAEPGAVVRYTTDGSEPTQANGQTYSSPLPLSTTTILRVAAFAPGKLPSSVVTHTYLFNLDPSLQSLPVLSLITATNNLFGETGIMETEPRNTVNRGIEWERPVSAEWIRPDDNGGFQADSGLRIQGGDYVRNRYDPLANLPFSKYSFRLYFRGDYGLSRLEYPVVPRSVVESYDVVSLRAGMNDHSNPFIVDELVRRIYAETGQISAQGSLANLFLNGEYKGYYNPTERIDEDFLQSQTGSTEEWDLIAQFNEIAEGDTVEWNRLRNFMTSQDLSLPLNYAHAQTLLDIDAFIDYLLVNVYAATGDWPHNNWRAARERTPDAKWKFIVWDAEWAMGNSGRTVDRNTFVEQLTTNTDISNIFRSLMRNSEFKMRWADRVHRHFFNGGALMDNKILSLYWELRNEMSGVLPGMNSYIHNTFIPNRRAVIFDHMRDEDLYRSDHAPVFSQHGGRVPGGYQLGMTSAAGNVYYTLDGTDPRLPAPEPSQTFTWLTETAPKRALVPSSANGGDQLGDAWKGGGAFNDSTWAQGTSGVGYEASSGYESYFDIDFLSEMFDVNTTAFIRIPFSVDAGEMQEANRLLLQVQYDDGFVAYVNGVRVASANAPETLAWNSGASGGNNDASAINFAGFDITDHLGLLNPGANLLAIHGLNSGTQSSDFLINARIVAQKTVPGEVHPDAIAYTGSIPIGQTTTVRARSLDNGVWSALTDATFVVDRVGLPLRFTEIMYHPSPDNDAYEFIELQNYGSEDVALAGYSFDGVDFRFPPGSIVAGGQTVLLASNTDPSLFAQRYPGTTVHGYFGGSLSNAGERIALLDADNHVVIAMEYGDGNGWSPLADGNGGSLVLVDPTGDPSQWSSWNASTAPGGNPGLPPTPATVPSIRINEVAALNTTVNHEGTFPDWMEIHNAGTTPVDLAGWSVSDNENPQQFVFPSGITLPAGGYLIVWCDAAATSGLHTGFALNAGGESIALFDSQGNRVDAVGFGIQIGGYTLSRLEGGTDSWQLAQPTPGQPNQAIPLAAHASLTINEWLANPIAGQPDWIELHLKHNTRPASLHNLSIGNGQSLHRIASRSFIAPSGYLQLFANEETGPDELSFKLTASGGSLELYASDGTLLEQVEYSQQAENVSMGHYPDGTGAYTPFPGSISPAAPNYLLNYSGPIINEVMALNESFPNAAGDRPDWIELHNPSGTVFDLSGMSLSVGNADPGEWMVPSGVTMAPGQHLVIWFDSNRPASTALETELNAGRNLSGNGETLHLFNAQSQSVQSLTFGLQITDRSIGLVNGIWQLLSAPTPGAANSSAATYGNAASLRFNEWLSNPSSGDDWFELYNPETLPVALGGLHVTDDPSPVATTRHTFTELSFLDAGHWARLVADSNPGNGADHVSFNLASGGEHLRLYDSNLQLIDFVDFGSQTMDASEGLLPDNGTARVAFTTTPTPAASNYLPLQNVLINEVLAHTDPPLEDAVEIYNPGQSPVSLDGWFLSDSELDFKKYQIAPGTTLSDGSFRVFYENAFNGGAGSIKPFSLNSARGDSIYLSETDSQGNLTGYRAQAHFGPSFNGFSFGRHPTSLGDVFVRMNRSFGQDQPQSVEAFRTGTGRANEAPIVGPIVIHEVFNDAPDLPSLDAGLAEFVELRNVSATDASLFDATHPENTWRLRGDVDFDFPAGLTLGPGEYLLVVAFNPITDPTSLAAFRGYYQLDESIQIAGPYQGNLSSEGQSLSLLAPDTPQSGGPDAGLVPYVTMETIDLVAAAPWPIIGLGSGASVQKNSGALFGNEPLHWRTGTPTPGDANESALDTDQDGIPDYWETRYGLNPNLASDAQEDDDGDGITNVREYQSGTAPNDALSYLRVDDINAQPGSSMVTFRAAAGRSYTLEYRDAIGQGDWTVMEQIEATYYDRVLQISDNAAFSGTRFYRLVTPGL